MLLAAALPGDTPVPDLWRAYASPAPHLRDVVVMDPFLGGGTTLVEAARLGARARGTDVDPLAVLINRHQLSPPARQDILAAGELLTAHLRATIGHLWPATTESGFGWSPLHYFSVAVVTCPHCRYTGALYRSLVIARSVGHAGSVVREVAVTAFCPECFGVHDLGKPDKALTCCGSTRLLTDSTFRGTRYECPSCGHRSSHEALQTGAAPRALLAVEETPGDGPRGTPGFRRRIRAAAERDRALAQTGWGQPPRPANVSGDDLPIRSAPNDGRPASFGIRTIAQLHTARQFEYLAEARRWLQEAQLDPPVARALSLAISSTVTSNNRLCGYATDYGRLAPLFSIRAFSLPWLAVELNPLNPSGGRGTLAAALTRMARSCEDTARRHVLDSHGRAVPVTLTWPRRYDGHQVRCVDAGATRPEISDSAGDPADLCVTDPPYYDFISYDALSQVYRAWLPETGGLAGPALLPSGDDPVASFGARLGQAFAQAVSACRPEALLAFTYKGDAVAWDAVAVALDQAKLRVTGLWPVLADPHMGHHAHEGNCEYDMIVVTRPLAATESWPPPADVSAETWINKLGQELEVSAADRANMRSAISIAAPRWGRSVQRQRQQSPAPYGETSR